MGKYSKEFLSKFNWVEIQDFYNNDKTWCDIIEKFGLNNSLISHVSKLGLLKTRSRSESTKISIKNNPRLHTEESKQKISKSRIKYLSENPDKVPYLINHSSKESYPEKYFSDIFQKESMNVTSGFRIGLYELDFCILNKKIDIEIDGNQHYYDQKIVKSDQKRNKFLEDQGWKVIRIKWSDYQKLNKESKIGFINSLKNFINERQVSLSIDLFDSIKRCKLCGSQIGKKSNLCVECHYKNIRRVDRSDKNTLLQDINKLGYVGTGKKYGVSDNAIRKWIKNYN